MGKRKMISKALNMLMKEHKKILGEVEKLEEECNAVKRGKKIDEAFFRKAIDFIRNYADKFHHAKEENILFKEICNNEGHFHCNPVQQMLLEHKEGRTFVKDMEEGLNKEDKEKILSNSGGYIQLIREHIYKEDNILYPMVDENLSNKQLDGLFSKFKKIKEKK